MKELLTILLILFSQMSYSQTDPYMPSYKYDVNKVTIFDDIEMAYVDEGSKDAPIILMVHGLGGYIKNWYPTIDGLSKDYRCIALDLPGYGQSTIRSFDEEDYMAFFAKAVDAFVNELKLENVTLLGHSMGGQVSMVLAIQNPSWLKQLILAAPAGFETFTEQEAAALKSVSTAAAIMSHEEPQVRAAYQINFVEIPPLAEELIQDRLKAKEASWFEHYAYVREKAVIGMLVHPVFEELESIKIPTCVIFGQNDLLIPNKFFHADLTTEKIAQLGKNIKDAKINMIEPAGHMLQMDNPEDFNQTINQFLTR